MRTIVSIEELQHILESVVGMSLSATSVFGGDQVEILFHFGRRIPANDVREASMVWEDQEVRSQPLTLLLTAGEESPGPDEAPYRSEMTLAVWCNWRVEMGETHVVCGSRDSSAKGGPIFTGLKAVLGDTVADVSLDSFLDLRMTFNCGKRLRLFCDQSGHENNDDSYRILTADGRVYGVVTGLVELEQRQT